MMHITFGLFVVDTVEELGIRKHTEGSNGKNLGLTSAEQTGAVNSGKQSHFRMEGTNLFKASAVDTFMLVYEHFSDNVFLSLVYCLRNESGAVGIFLGKVIVDILGNDGHAGITLVLVIVAKGGTYGILAVRLDIFIHFVRNSCAGIGKLRLAHLGLDHLNELDDLFDSLMSKYDTLQHNVFGDLVGTGFDHNDLLFGSGNGNGHLILFFLSLGGVDHIFTVNIAQAYTADGSVPGDVRNGYCNGSTDHTGDLRGTVGVNGHNTKTDNNIVSHILGEQRTDGSVYNTGGKDRLFGRSSLSLQKTSGDLSHGIQFFLKVNGKGEEINAVTGLFGGGSSGKNRGLAVSYHARTVGKPGEFSDFHNKRTSGKCGFKFSVMFVNVHLNTPSEV